jgi:hypothetical protein
VIQGFIGGGGVQPLTLFNLINLTEAVITGPDSIAGMMRRNSSLTETTAFRLILFISSPGFNGFSIQQIKSLAPCLRKEGFDPVIMTHEQ